MGKNKDYSGQNKILILTGGDIDQSFLKSLIDQVNYSLVFAVDRGLLAADKLKIEPDYILGDFDSVPEDILLKYRTMSIPIISFPKMKDKTDTQIAFEKAIEHNAKVIDLVGATGSRMDHTMANMDLLMLGLEWGISASILDPNNKIYLKKESFVIRKDDQHGDFISLLPFSFQVKELVLKGFKYPLDGIVLTAGSSLGISNELIEDQASVEFEEGILAVFETRD
ncbi:MAG: thiamine diphosphokinase [Clostridiales bacterium]|nr:thiamine diphosphokinase [Bacillota bacterium]NLK04297.1 thiamine diphosphokinase [Clostridiales bacterium]